MPQRFGHKVGIAVGGYVHQVDLASEQIFQRHQKPEESIGGTELPLALKCNKEVEVARIGLKIAADARAE